MKTARPEVSVIIPNYNDGERLARCLEALEKQDYNGDFEILVVDNGSETLPQTSGRARVLVETAPGSYAARNAGIAEARAEFLAFTDADCLPSRHWLSAGMAALRRDPSVGLVGGAVELFHEGFGSPSLPALLELVSAFPQRSYVEHGRYAATANMFTRAAVFDRVGVFAGNLRSGGDAEWGNRVADASYALRFEPLAIVAHPVRATHEEFFSKAIRVVAGHRDRDPSCSGAFGFSLRHLLPPRRRITSILKATQLPLRTRLRLAGFCYYLNLWLAATRLRMQLLDVESARS